MFLKYEDLAAISKERAERDEISRLGRSFDKGVEATRRDMAVKMLRDGLGLDFVSKYTGLSATELSSLKTV